jgi:hypothetical protein
MARTNSWAAAARRAERASAQRRRELLAYARQFSAWQEGQRAQYEVSVYENQVEFLLSMHKDCGPERAWNEIVRQAPPPPPQRGTIREAAARADLASYTPTVVDRWFGGAKKRLSELEQSILAAQAEDSRAYEMLRANHAAVVAQQDWERQIGQGVLHGDLHAYRTVIEHLSPFDELAESGMNVNVSDLRPDLAVLWCTVADLSIMPTAEKKLTAAGKVASKAIPKGTYWGIYQDYVCGCALRAARELLALLPLSRVVTNIGSAGIDTATGHNAITTILAVNMPSDIMRGLRFDALDPSDSMSNFFHRMKFRKTSGFEPVEPMGADETGMSITTGRSAR